MKAIILVGGKGTRLRPLTSNTPKPMVPVLNHPFLEHLLRNLKSQGISDVILASNYQPGEIRDTIGDGGQFGVRLVYVVEETPLGTSGAVKNAERYLDEPFYVFNGDVLSQIDLVEMMRRHREARAEITIALVPVDNPTIYGVVETGKGGMVTRFLEKPSWKEATTNLINAGVYIVEPEVLQHIPAGVPSMFENYLFPKLLEMNEPILSYPSDVYWIDIGTPEKYLRLNQDLLLQKGKEIFLEGKNRIDPGAHLEPPVLIGAGCVIGAGAKVIGPSVLGAKCRVATGATVEQSVLWPRTEIGAGTFLKSSVAAYCCRIKEDCYLEKCILGDHVVIGLGTWECEARIPSRSKVPSKNVP